MTQDEIIRFAIQCRLVTTGNCDGLYMDALTEFANLAAAKEREACAKIAEQSFGVIGSTIALAIRARGEQEPVADDFFRMIADRNPKPFPLPQRTWVGLTDEEIDAIYTGVRAVHHEINSDLFARAIEAKLKELNT